MNSPLRGARLLPVVPLLAVGLWGCLSGSEPELEAAGGAGGSEPQVTGRVVAQLQRAEDCEDLLTKIHQDAVAKVNAMADNYREQAAQQRVYYEESKGTGASGAPPPMTPMDGGVAWGPDLPTVQGGSGGSSVGAAGMGGSMDPSFGDDGESERVALDGSGATPSDANGLAEGPGGHSDTNVQVEDVDEADIVKVDDAGRIYLLHGNQLFLLDAWPASSLALGPDLVIEGMPLEMFVRDGRAVVYSRVFDDGKLGAEAQQPAYDGYYYDDDYYYCGGGPEFTKISLIDVGGETPAVVREIYVQGSYRSARLHNSLARTVVQGGFKAPGLFYPEFELTDPWGRPYEQEVIDSQIDAWRDRVVASIRDTELSDWLPLERELVDGEIVDVERRCRDFYLPSPGLTEYGLTNIVALDITEDSGPLSGAAILGSVSEVYSSEKTMLLAHQQWEMWDRSGEEGQRTALHGFELNADTTLYSASGFVPGHILNQFSMDVDDEAGVIRLATTKETWDEDSRFDNRVFTLQADGDELKVLGSTERLGHKDERIFSTRFVWDMAYVVTFQQRDPLIVIDLSDPKKPVVLGEAVIPGFSDYMHPLGDDHLLTIGRNTDEWGSDIGLLLQIFDVSEPTDPQRTQIYEFAPDGYSNANHDHKAFTYWADKQLLAFPFFTYGGGYYDEQGNYFPSYPGSTLEVFKVSIDEGFDRLGAVDHTPLMLENGCLVKETYYDYDAKGLMTPYDDYYWQCSEPEVRRGIFMDEYVYAISYAGVSVHELSDLNEPVAQVTLPVPVESNYCYGYAEDDIMMAEPGWVGPAGMGGIGVAPIAGMGGAAGAEWDGPVDAGVKELDQPEVDGGGAEP